MHNGWEPFHFLKCQLPLIALTVTSVLCIAISIYSLSAGWFIIFQNLYYIPIIISCFYYGRRGFIFSAILACIYFLLILAFTKESSIIMQAIVRVLIFILIAGVITYLSSLRKQVNELRVTNVYNRNLIEASLDPMVVIRADGRIMDVNAATETATGYLRAELIGTEFFEYFSDPDKARDIYQKVFRESSLRNSPLELQHRDGHVTLVLYNASVYQDEQGQIVGVFAAARDVTDLKLTEQKLMETLESLRKAFGITIKVLVSAVEARDPYTSGHQIRSAGLARAIATEMGLPQEKIDGIRMAGSIHDIGKLSTPAEILSKPGKLTNAEFSLIKEHPWNGYEILKDVESSWPLAEIIYQHHERMDGSGYPRGLKGDEILIEARILSVADVVESMASHRPYRPALGVNAALDEIEKNRGTLYDADVVDACLRLFREKSFQL
jgi:PAS domain S-box-containing protein